MQNDYWLQKWQDGDTKFNQEQVHPSLTKYFGALRTGRVFVPLCGKTIDMLWLAKERHEVIGCELSEIPCRAFFKENNLEHSEEKVTLLGGQTFNVFKSDRISIWCGDFFEMPTEALQITAIYDRASIVALPQDMRARYANKICDIAKLSQHEVTYLLVTFEYDQALVDGPPFNVSSAEVHSLFDNTFGFEREDRLSTSALGNNPKFDGVAAVEKAYVLRLLPRKKN